MFVKIEECSANSFPVVIDGLLSTTVDGKDIQEERWTDCADTVCVQREKVKNNRELLP